MKRRVAVIGAGIGREHVEAYLALPDHFDVAVICDLNEERARYLAAEAGARISTDLANALNDPEIDLIDICLPPSLHFETAKQALLAEKDVIVEKPIAASLLEVDALFDLSAETGGRVFPVFQYRYGPAFDQLNALEAFGMLGKPYVATVETHWCRKAEYYTTPWRGTWAYELGGAVLSHAIHAHNILARYFGPIEAVSAMLATRVNPIETEDCAAILFRMASGALANSSITLGSSEDMSRFRLVFEHVTIESGRLPYAPAADQWRFLAREAAQQKQIDEIVAGAVASPVGFIGYLKAVYEALEGISNRAITLEEGRGSLELASAIYLANQTKREVSLPLDRNEPIAKGFVPK